MDKCGSLVATMTTTPKRPQSISGTQLAESQTLMDLKKIINFRYKPKGRGRWRKGKPLPADLRDSGIESHCSFALNKTHVFLAGGKQT